MPKYRDKIQLKRMLLRKGDIDPLTQWLVLQGYPGNQAERGLESFVESWEEQVQWFEEREGYFDPDEHGHDIMPRTMLYIVMQQASETQIDQFRKRIEAADALFKKITIERNTPFDPIYDEIKKVDREEHWWLFRDDKFVLNIR